jgi:SOS-response transcriptional repressor LexA
VSKNEKKREIPVWSMKIAQARKKLGMSQETFADRLDTKQSNVSKWESGAYRPSPEHFVKIARLLGGGIESLFFYAEGGIPESFFEKENAPIPPVLTTTTEPSKLQRVPLYHDPVAAGQARAVDPKDVEAQIPFLWRWLPRSGDLRAFRVQGESMSPILETGYVVIVDVASRSAENLVGHMVAAREGDGITIKWLRRDGKTYLLVPQHTSPAYPVKVMRPDDFSIVGEVVKWIGYPPPVRK